MPKPRRSGDGWLSIDLTVWRIVTEVDQRVAPRLNEKSCPEALTTADTDAMRHKSDDYAEWPFT